MPSTTTVTMATSEGTTRHEISLQGLAGGFFWSTLVSVIFFIVGFATAGWVVNDRVHIGLWESCTCGGTTYSGQGWFLATRAFSVLGLICLVGAVIVAGLYMFVHRIDKYLVLKIFIGFTGAAVLCLFLALVIFGSSVKSGMGYSYGFVVIAAILILVGLVLGIVQCTKARQA